jgi:glycosyltransferase involved in cell wall biosynthesis
VDTERFTPGNRREDFYVTTSRMVPYKRIDLIVEAFATMPDRQLIVIGDGPESRRIRAKGSSNIRFLGQQSFPVLRDHLQRARAFVFAAEEDFGIAPVEAQACGTPVIALGKGGALESLRGLGESEPTAVFYQEQSVDALRGAVAEFEAARDRITSAACRTNALRFGIERFLQEITQHLGRVLQAAERFRQIPMTRDDGRGDES